MTKRPGSRDSVVMMFSVSPSLKYSCSGSPLMLSKGSTAMDGLSGSGKAMRSTDAGSSRVAHGSSHSTAAPAIIAATVATAATSRGRQDAERPRPLASGSGTASPGVRRTRYTRTGFSRPLSSCSPRPSSSKGIRRGRASWIAAVTHTPPGSANCSTRCARTTPAPVIVSWAITSSPRAIPTRTTGTVSSPIRALCTVLDC